MEDSEARRLLKNTKNLIAKSNSRMKALIRTTCRLAYGRDEHCGRDERADDLAQGFILEIISYEKDGRDVSPYGTIVSSLHYDDERYNKALYAAFKYYLTSTYKKHNRRHQLEQDNLFEVTPQRSSLHILSDIFKTFTEEEATLALWRLGLMTEEQTMDKLGCSRNTIFNKHRKMKERHGYRS